MPKELKLSTQLFAKQILITNNNIQAKCQEFIDQLWESYSDYKTSLDKEKKAWQEVLKAKTVFIEPEKLTARSPLTILDAPWGSGKTYFIEHLAKLFALSVETTNSKKKKLNKKGFVNLVVIDTWKFINSDIIVFDIVKKIYLIICQLITKTNQKVSKKIWTKLAWLFYSFMPIALLLTNAALKLYFQDFPDFSAEILAINQAAQNKKREKQKELDEIDYDQAIAEISEQLEPTIVVFDNVERMGNQAWEIIKTIQKLAVFANFVFVLPMNKNKLTLGQLVDQENHEAVIDKYLTLGIYFELKQDYFGLLKKLKLPSEYIEIVAEILNDEINGSKLSIRTLENALKANYVIEAFKTNKFCGLRFLKTVWSSKKIDEIIDNDLLIFKNLIKKLEINFIDDPGNRNAFYEFEEQFNILAYTYNQIEKKNIEKYKEFKYHFIETKNHFTNWFHISWTDEWQKDINFLKKDLLNEIKILQGDRFSLCYEMKQKNNFTIEDRDQMYYLERILDAINTLIIDQKKLIIFIEKIEKFNESIKSIIDDYRSNKDQNYLWNLIKKILTQMNNDYSQELNDIFLNEVSTLLKEGKYSDT